MNNQSIESITKMTNDLSKLLDVLEQPPIYNYVNSLFIPFNQFCYKFKDDFKNIKIENKDGNENKDRNDEINNEVKKYEKLIMDFEDNTYKMRCIINKMNELIKFIQYQYWDLYSITNTSRLSVKDVEDNIFFSLLSIQNQIIYFKTNNI